MREKTIKEKLQYGLIYKDIRKTYVIIIGILSLILSIGYISYASFSVQKEKSNGISIVTGNLIYNLQGKCITNNKIEIGPNETKEIEVTIESLNSIESCYQMYYQNNPNIEISYIESSDAPYQESIGAHPGDDYTKVTTIIIKNKTDEIQSVEIGVQGGLTGKELVLEEGRVKIEDIARFSIRADSEVIIDSSANVGSRVEFSVSEREGYIYDGAEIVNSSGEVIEEIDNTNQEFIMPVGDIYIRIKWKQKSYLISKEEVVGGTITIGNSAVEASEVSFSIVESKGYDYGGSTVKDTRGNILLELERDVNKFIMPSSDIIVVPKWIAKTYTIIYHANGGEGSIASHVVTFGQGYTITSNSDGKFTKRGYTFAGWTTRSDGTDDSNDWRPSWTSTWNYVDGEYGIANGQLNLYAMWSANTYTINYHANGGSGTIESQVVTYGHAASIATNSFTKRGYTFSCWSVGGQKDEYGWTKWSGTWGYIDGQYGIKDGVLDLYAIWSPNNYAIVYHANGGSGTMETHTVTYGQSASIHSNAYTRDGYKFVGWTTRSDGADDKCNWTGWSGTWSYIDGEFGIGNVSSGALVLYARWTNQFNITLNQSGSGTVNYPKTVTYNQKVTFTVTPASGYRISSMSVTFPNVGMSQDYIWPFSTTNDFTMPASDAVINVTFVKSG